jgi:gliding motility-associated-like protein
MTISLQAQPFCKKENLFGETVFLEGSPRNDNAATNCLYSVVKGNDIIEIYSDKLVWFEGGKSFTKQWVNCNSQAVNVPQNKTNYYFTGGNKSGKQYGYKKLIFKNLYPNTDLIYELIQGELKYSFNLHKNAKIEDIQFEIIGSQSLKFNPNNIEFSIDSTTWKEDKLSLLFAETAKTIPKNSCRFRKIKEHIFGFELQNPTLKPPYLIDPFVRKTTILYGVYVGKPHAIVDVEHDLDGNLYIYGGDGYIAKSIPSWDSASKYPFDPRYNNYFKIAKYSKSGSLIWIFKGYDTTAKYVQNNMPTGITVDRANQSIYSCHSHQVKMFSYKTKLVDFVQLKNDGSFNNYAPEIKYDYKKIGFYNTVLPFYSNVNSKILGVGWLNDTGILKGLFVYNKDSSSTYHNVVKVTNPFLNGPVNGPVIFGLNANTSLYNVFYFRAGYYYIQIQKLLPDYSEAWRTDSFFITPYRILGGYVMDAPNVVSITANLLSSNDSNLVYFDGHTIKIYKTSNGKKICQDTLQNKIYKLSNGVAIDPCNNIFVAGDSSKIYCYHLKDTMLTLQKTLTIDNYKHRYLFDVEYDAQRNLIYATGDSILASVQSPFSCVDSSMVSVLDSTNNICWQPIVAGLKKSLSESVYSFEWTDTTVNQVVRAVNKLGNATDTLANPTEGHTYKLRIMKNKTNLGLFKDLYFNVLKSSKDTQTIHVCLGDTIKHPRLPKYFTNNTLINDTLSNFAGCDSVITLKLVFHPKFKDTILSEVCMGDTLQFGKRRFTSSANYIDTLNSIWGCDSLIWRDIHFFGSRDTQQFNICRGNTIQVGVHSYSMSGFYSDTFVNFKGCDSIVCTNLIVHHDTTFWIKHIICDGDSLKIAGKFRKSSGDFTDSFKGVWGCDSVIKHQLIVNKRNRDTIKLHLCKNQKVVINGKSYASNANITEIYKNIWGCDSVVNYIIQQSNMIADFDIDTSQNPMLIFKNKSIGNTKFFWDFGDKTLDSINKDPSHTYNNDETHFVRICLSLVDSFGCTDTICQTVEISKLVYWLFNSFSPGNDGYNDIFKIGHKGGTFNYNMMIYNRWGALVFETKDANIKDESKFWNGKVMNTGADCPAGSYFVLYQLYVNGPGNPPKEVHGVITLIK